MNEMQTSAGPSLVMRHTFKAPRVRVFAAWTDPDVLREWFGPAGATAVQVSCDAREGGAYRMAFDLDGETYVVSGVFTQVRAPERLAYTFRWEEDDPALERETFITLDFIERGDETEMVFKQDGFRDEASRDRHEDGWNGTFDKLGATL